MEDKQWYRIESPGKILSPALLLYPARIRHNIKEMIRLAGDVNRLWPHIKTHKSADVIRMQQEAGIEKFKCSTLSEAALLGKCGVTEALLAMQPTAAHLNTYFKIQETYPMTRFSTLVDNRDTLSLMQERTKSKGQSIRLWLDVNNGMDRTGIAPGLEAIRLVEDLCADPLIDFMGLHVYDGHIRDSDPKARAERCHRDMEPVLNLQRELTSKGLEIRSTIAGGSPSFPIHAKRKEFDLSPGTTLLWDAGYGQKFPDMPFRHAAVLMTRVISKPAPGLVCTDLGHKSVASEMPFPRVALINSENCEQVSQSEEHLVLSCGEKNYSGIGEILYALPMHICPTVPKHPSVHIVEENRVIGRWSISALDHNVEIKTDNHA